MDISDIGRWEDAKAIAAEHNLTLRPDLYLGDGLSIKGGTRGDEFFYPLSTVREALAFVTGYARAMEQKVKEDAIAEREEIG